MQFSISIISLMALFASSAFAATTGTAALAASTTSSAPPAAATGSLCFDAGDCLLSGGGECVRSSSFSITGNCGPATAGGGLSALLGRLRL